MSRVCPFVRVSAVPSPQSTLVDAIVPSASEAVIEAVTVCPDCAVAGETDTVTTGGRSETVIVDVGLDAVEPLLSVTVTVIA